MEIFNNKKEIICKKCGEKGKPKDMFYIEHRFSYGETDCSSVLDIKCICCGYQFSMWPIDHKERRK